MVGNQLGKSIFFDEIRLRSNNKKMVVLLIELDISKGLISELEIVCGDFSFIRPLNYCGLLLRCRRCCKVGYLIIKKSLLLLQKLLFLIKILNMLFFLTLIVLQAILVLKDTDSWVLHLGSLEPEYPFPYLPNENRISKYKRFWGYL